MESYDVIVIGSGASGLLAAPKASVEGSSVMITEKTKID
jgi:predicted flavoprotein YhiN